MSTKKIVVELTQYQAQRLGIVRCECGHPRNNHFDFKARPCAHCTCRRYKQVVVLPPAEDPEKKA